MEQEAPPSPPPQAPSPSTAIFATPAGIRRGDPSSSPDHHAFSSLRFSTQSEVHSSLSPLPPPRITSSTAAAGIGASYRQPGLHSPASSVISSAYQQIPPPPEPAFDHVSSLHARRISQPSLNTSSSLLASSSFGPIHVPFSNLEAPPPAVSSLAMTVPSLGSQQQSVQAPSRAFTGLLEDVVGRPLLGSDSREGFWQSNAPASSTLRVPDYGNTTGKSQAAMPKLRIGGGSDSSSGSLFTDAEMEKIRNEKRLSDLVKSDPKMVRRLLNNREHTKNSAKRKENHRAGLEQRLRVLQKETEELSGQAKLRQEEVAEVASQNTTLSTRVEELEKELKLKEDLNEVLRSSIQTLSLADQSSSSGSHERTK